MFSGLDIQEEGTLEGPHWDNHIRYHNRWLSTIVLFVFVPSQVGIRIVYVLYSLELVPVVFERTTHVLEQTYVVYYYHELYRE